MSDLVKYVIGFAGLMIGGALGAGMLGVPAVWIAVGLVALAGAGTLTVLRQIRRP